jgi:hypothetical protein
MKENETNEERRARLEAGVLIVTHEVYPEDRPCCLCDDGWQPAALFGAYILDRNFEHAGNEVCDRCLKALDPCMYEALIAGRRAAHRGEPPNETMELHPNTRMNGQVCALCQRKTKPIGLDPFLTTRTVVEPVCNTCMANLAPELVEERQRFVTRQAHDHDDDEGWR